MVISRNYIINPSTSQIVFEYKAKRDVIFNSGYYKFISTPDNLCWVNFLIDNKPSSLWLDNPVKVNHTLRDGQTLKIEVVNSSANTHIMNINLHIEDEI